MERPGPSAQHEPVSLEAARAHIEAIRGEKGLGAGQSSAANTADLERSLKM